MAKAIIRRFTDAMANHDHNFQGYQLTTFSSKANYIGVVNHRNLESMWRNVRLGGGTRVMTGQHHLHKTKHHLILKKYRMAKSKRPPLPKTLRISNPSPNLRLASRSPNPHAATPPPPRRRSNRHGRIRTRSPRSDLGACHYLPDWS